MLWFLHHDFELSYTGFDYVLVACLCDRMTCECQFLLSYGPSILVGAVDDGLALV